LQGGRFSSAVGTPLAVTLTVELVWKLDRVTPSSSVPQERLYLIAGRRVTHFRVFDVRN
jgi:hypothetical protein